MDRFWSGLYVMALWIQHRAPSVLIPLVVLLSALMLGICLGRHDGFVDGKMEGEKAVIRAAQSMTVSECFKAMDVFAYDQFKQGKALSFNGKRRYAIAAVWEDDRP